MPRAGRTARPDQSVIRGLWKYVRHYKVPLVCVATIAVIGPLLELATATILRRLTDILTLKGVDGPRQLMHVILAWVSVAGVLMLARYVRVTSSTTLAEGTIKNIRGDFFRAIQDIPLSHLEKYHSGDLVSRLTSDLEAVRDALEQRIYSIVQGPLMFIAAITYLAFLNWRLTLLMLPIGPITVLFSNHLVKRVRRAAQEQQKYLSQINGMVQEGVSGTIVVRAFGIKEYLVSRFAQVVDKCSNYGIVGGRYKAVLGAGSNLLSSSPYIILFGVGGHFVLSNQLTVGSLLAFMNLMGRLVWPFTEMVDAWAAFQRSMSGTRRVLEVINDVSAEVPSAGTVPTVFVDASPKAVSTGQDAVRLEDVTFGYREETPVVKRLSLRVPVGSTTALVGTSGSGKSTILKLILGLYNSYEGAISVFGRDIRGLNPEEICTLISYVPQDPTLFSGSVSENIALGLQGVSHDMIVEAAKVAHADEFIQQLPHSYATYIGEKGGALSGGQRQRIAIARALLRNSPLVLLDEATSALDEETQEKVNDSMRRLAVGRTCLIIAHRPSTIETADAVVVVDKGEVVFFGEYQEARRLMRVGGQ